MSLFGPNIEKMKSHHDIAGLIKILENNNEKLRSAAKAALVELKDEQTIIALVEALDNPVSMVWENAQQALAAIGAPAFQSLNLVMDTCENKMIRVRASWCLATISKTVTDRALASQMITLWMKYLLDIEEEIRTNAVFSLNKLYNLGMMEDANIESVALAVLTALGDPYEPVQKNAMVAMRWVEPQLIKSGISAVPILLRLIPEQTAISDLATNILIKIGLPAAQCLIPIMKDSSVIDRGIAGSVLIQMIKSAPEVELASRLASPAINSLSDVDADVRGNGAVILFHVLPLLLDPTLTKTAVEQLLTCARDPDITTRRKVMNALAITDSENAVPALIEALGDEDTEVVISAVRGLEKSDGPSVLNPLIRVLTSKNENIRKAAIPAVAGLINKQPAQTGDITEAEVALCQLLGDSSEEVRKAAKNALIERGFLARPVLLAQLDNKDYHIRKSAFEILGQMGMEEDQEMVYKMLQDPIPDIRCQAVKIIESNGFSGTVALIAPLVNDTDRDVKKTAVKALDHLKWEPDRTLDGVSYWILKGQWKKALMLGDFAIKPVLDIYSHSKDPGIAKALGQAGSQTNDPQLVSDIVDTLVNDLVSDEKSRRMNSARVLVAMYNSQSLPETVRQKILSSRAQIRSPHQDYSTHKDGPHWDEHLSWSASDCNTGGGSSHTDFMVTTPGALYKHRINTSIHTDQGIGAEFDL